MKNKESHKENIQMFTPEYNIERDMFIEDIERIIRYGRNLMNDDELKLILTDCKNVLNFSSIKPL